MALDSHRIFVSVSAAGLPAGGSIIGAAASQARATRLVNMFPPLPKFGLRFAALRVAPGCHTFTALVALRIDA